MTKFKKLLSVLLCVCIIAVPVASGIISAGAESNADLQKLNGATVVIFFTILIVKIKDIQRRSCITALPV